MNSPPPVDPKRVYFSSLSILFELIMVTLSYQNAIVQHVFFDAPYGKGSSLFSPSVDLHASVQIYSLSLIFKLWSLPHYRSTTYKQDCIDNLKNVAIPGTGIPLSYFCHNYYICLVFVLAINPLICLFGAINKASHDVFNNINDKSNNNSNNNTSGQGVNTHKGIATEIILKIKHFINIITTLDLHSLERFLVIVLNNFILHLLHPDDWFSLWQMNCRLASYHSLITKSTHYSMEDKWTFLVEGKELDVPVSPFMTMETLVCKNKNIEGGMGIHFYKNATCGGDWILQEKFTNADWLSRLLPLNSPLSTMRIITSSRLGLSSHMISSSNNYNNYTSMGAESMDEVRGDVGVDNEVWKDVLSSSRVSTPGSGPYPEISSEIPVSVPGSPSVATTAEAEERSSSISPLSPLAFRSSSKSILSTPTRDPSVIKGSISSGDKNSFIHHNIQALSAVLRLGRAGASTDHSSVLFDVDLATGRVLKGMSNAHWYKLGVPQAVLAGPWLSQQDNSEIHPDPPHPQVTGQIVPGMHEAIDIVVKAHFKMMPEVPMVGWDVAFTPNGVFLLEVNLSCNFFRGTFDLPRYTSFVGSYFTDMERLVGQGKREETSPSERSGGSLNSKLKNKKNS